MNSLTLKRKIKNPFHSPSPILITPSPASSSSPSVVPHYPPSVSPNTIHTFNTADTDQLHDDEPSPHPHLHHHHHAGEEASAAKRDGPQREIIARGRDYSDEAADKQEGDSLNEPSTPDGPAPLRPRSPTRILPRRRAASSSTQAASSSGPNSAGLRPSTAPAPAPSIASSRQPTKKASSDMSIAASSSHFYPQLHKHPHHHHHRMSPSRDSWSSSLDLPPSSSRTTLDTSAPLRGTYTADLADFLRSTGPDEPPTQPTQRGQPQTESEVKSTPNIPAQSNAKSSSSVFTLKKYLKKGANSTGLGKKDGTLPGSAATASTTSLNKRKLTAESFGSSGSAAVTAAVNKALHNVPPPTNVQPKVFANGHTIYMINTPSQLSSSNNTPSVDNNSTINNHQQQQHQYASPASAYAATISAARGAKMMPGLANKPQPPPLRSAVSFHGTSPSTSPVPPPPANRPKTASGETTPTPSTTANAYVPPPPVPRIPSPIKKAAADVHAAQVHDALLVVPRAPHPHHQREMSGATVRRALSPIGGSEDAHGDEDEQPVAVPEDYDIQFDSAASGEEGSRRRDERLPAEVDGSDLDPTLIAISRMRAAQAAARNRSTAVAGVAEETEEDEEHPEITGVKEMRSQTPRLGSTSSTILSQRSRGSARSGSIQSIGSYTAGAAAGGRTTPPSSMRRSGSISLHSAGSAQNHGTPERSRKTPSPTAPRQLPPPTTGLPPLPTGTQEIDPQWVSRDAAAAPSASPRMVVTAASPAFSNSNFPFGTVSPHLVVGRDRSGSDGVSVLAPKSPVDAGPYRRDRSMSVGVGGAVTGGTRSSSGNMVYRAAGGDGANGLGLGSPPLNPPPAGPPPPTPTALLPKTPVRTVKASETPRSSIRRAVKARATVVLADEAPLSPTHRDSVAESNGPAAPVSPTESVPAKTPARRGSAPNMTRSSIQYILGPKTAPPVPPIAGARTTFGGYVFPAATESSESEMEKDESEDYDEEDEEDGDQTTKLPESPSHSSVYLKEQLENVLKMNDAYLELATADKAARRSSTKPAPTVVPPPLAPALASTAVDKTPVLGSPAEVISTRASKADSLRTVSVTSSRSGASSVSVGNINVAYVSSTNGPPRLPLPPSPVAVPGSVGPISPAASSPLVPTTSPTSAIQPATSPQAQITTLTYALHTQRNRYEALSNHLCQQQATWDDQRAAYETRLSEIEREKVDLLAEREQFAKRLQELEKELAERDHRISQLESEKFAWERERKGLRWLVTSGRMGASAGSRPTSRSGSLSKEPEQMKPTDSEATIVSTEDFVDESPANPEPKAVVEDVNDAILDTESVPASGSDQTLRIDVTEVTPTPRRSNNSSSTAASRPVSVISQMSAASSRTSLDDGLLHPRITTTSGPSSNKMKRHSMYEAATIATPTSVSRRPLSAALEDMLQKLRSLGEEEKDSSHEESSPKKSAKKQSSTGMTTSRSTPLLSVTPNDEQLAEEATPTLSAF
ncbi:hypothetical protein FS837_010729 [Tulasnella sp. UAMH 9824]|nr:hypothetical protein FS837_010729 [Tulasnella sp. UAMH 9824]